MDPAGAVENAWNPEIDGKRVDVVTAGKFIDKETKIRVVETSGNRVVVRAVRWVKGGEDLRRSA